MVFSEAVVPVKPSEPISCIPEPAVSPTPSADPEPATEVLRVDFKTPLAQVPATEASPEPQEKNVAGMSISCLTRCIKS